MVNHSNVVALDMTKQEVYKQLTSTKKWYMPHLKQQAASAFQARFENGTASEETTIKVFSLFGYVVETATQFRKQ
jgi:hypothetical protein